MKRLITLGVAIAATLSIAACGGGSSGASSATGSNTSSTASSATGSNTSSTASSATGSDSSSTVSLRQLPGVGSVLVDHTDRPLYSNNLEATGKILCDSACIAFWKPLTVTGGKPTASKGAGKLGVIKRPDGTSQLTINGKPLYTFVEDSPGNAKGNGFQDDFNGHHFTWNIVRAGGTTTTAAAPSSAGSAPTTTSSSSNSYGY